MIADESDPAAVDRETSHPVKMARREIAIVHPLAGAGNHPVLEAWGQIEQAGGIGDEIAIAGDFVAIARALAVLAEASPGEAEKGRRSEGRSGEGASVDHDWLPPRPRSAVTPIR